MTPPATTTTPAAPVRPRRPTALISTNGVCERIAVNGTFPANEDIFRVVSIAKSGKSVEIGIVGGSYDSGQPTATLKLGEKLTLVNTADGTRYVIVLKAKCTPGCSQRACAHIDADASRPPGRPPWSRDPAPASATTPIVTDALDTAPAPTS